MATLSDLASHHYHDSHSHHNNHNHHHHHRSSSHRSSSSKIAKGARGGHKVKPILKRLASTSSPKNSLDLDRGWEDQVVDLGYGSPTSYDAGRPSMSPSLRDVNFHLPQAWEPTGYSSASEGASGPFGATSAPGRASGTATPVGSGPSTTPEPSAALTSSSALLHNGATTTARSIGRGRYQHTRSASAASHVSIGTNGSNHRPGGSFVHPFQQTPRTSTPPLNYANSFTSFERENNPARDYSPTIITENDDDDDDLDHPPHASHHLSQSLAASSHLNRPQPSNSHSTTSLRRPSLGSQRTSSLSDMRNHLVNNHHSHTTTSSSGTSTHTAPLRVNTTPSFPRSVPTSARLAHASLTTPNSASDLHLSTSPTDSPRPSIHLASPSTASTAAMTPFRTSLEGTFRLRSRSDIETGVRHEDIREARRKFEEAERIKQEKYEAEQRRKQERKAEKERAAAARRNTGASDISNGSRPSFSRRRSPPLTSTVGSITGSHRARSHRSTTHHGGAATAATMTVMNEKTEGVSTGFLSSNYESMAGGEMPNYEPDINDVHFGTPMRANTTKRKTQSYWTAFVLWFRTRLLKLGRH